MNLVGKWVVSKKFGRGAIIEYFLEKSRDNLVVRFENHRDITVSYSYPKCIGDYLQILELDSETERGISCVYNSDRPHIEVVRRENVVLPTCTEKGYYDKIAYCVVCNKEVCRERVFIDKIRHKRGKVQKENEVRPTCTSEGSYEANTYCKICGVLMKSEKVTLPEKSHVCKSVESDTELTPASMSYIKRIEKVFYCLACGKKVSRSYYDLHFNTQRPCNIVNGHYSGNIGDTKKIIYPTCQKNGMAEYIYRCLYCNKILIHEYETTFPTDHSYIETKENIVESTCTTEGSYDAVTKCRYCGFVKSRRLIKIKKKEHGSEYVEEITKEPTRYQNGSFDVVHRCPDCKKEYSRFHYSIPKLVYPPSMYKLFYDDIISDDEVFYDNYSQLSDVEKTLFDSITYEGLDRDDIINLPIYHEMKKYGFEYKHDRFIFVGIK